MMDSNLGKEEKRNKLKIAIAKQTKVTKENIFGEGVDVPLLGKYKAMWWRLLIALVYLLKQKPYFTADCVSNI